MENTSQMFMSCAALESIFASSAPTSVKSGSLMFSGRNRLVGGSGYVPKQTDTHSKLCLLYTSDAADDYTRV